MPGESADSVAGLLPVPGQSYDIPRFDDFMENNVHSYLRNSHIMTENRAEMRRQVAKGK